MISAEEIKALMAKDERGLVPCKCCGSRPFIDKGKRGSCQLHGEPFQAILIVCKKRECAAKPKVEGGDIFNGGEQKAKLEAIDKWNRVNANLAISTLQTLLNQAAEALTFYSVDDRVGDGDVARETFAAIQPYLTKEGGIDYAV